MNSKKVEYFKSLIKSQLEKLRDTIGDIRYATYLNELDQINDIDELMKIAELQLQIDYADYMLKNIAVRMKNAGRDIIRKSDSGEVLITEDLEDFNRTFSDLDKFKERYKMLQEIDAIEESQVES